MKAEMDDCELSRLGSSSVEDGGRKEGGITWLCRPLFGGNVAQSLLLSTVIILPFRRVDPQKRMNSHARIFNSWND